MKNAIFSASAGLVIAVLLSSPSFAQTTPTNATPTPTPVVAEPEPAADVPLDELIEAAVTPEDRMRLLLRCSGPPPRPIAEHNVAKAEPASEPAVLSE
jgi:hypothetical protein